MRQRAVRYTLTSTSNAPRIQLTATMVAKLATRIGNVAAMGVLCSAVAYLAERVGRSDAADWRQTDNTNERLN
jgi:hypothetical protein